MNGNHDQADRPPLETLDGFKPSDLEKMVRYLEICAENGQMDPALWNRAVSFARRYPERWARILAD
jgi:hypothetical protein